MSKMNVSLALQGGGSHGAYTWGVLDRILEEREVEIEALSGASAGAMNAAVLASGYAAGGRNGAREALERFWTAVSEKTLAAHPASHPSLGVSPSLRVRSCLLPSKQRSGSGPFAFQRRPARLDRAKSKT